MKKELDGVSHTLETALTQYEDALYRISHKFRSRGKEVGFELDDIFNEACIGFIGAFNRFKEDAEAKFLTYLFKTINGHLLKVIREQNAGVKYPSNLKLIAYKIRREELLEKDPEEIAEIINKSISQVRYAIEYLEMSKPLNLEQRVGNSTDTDSTIQDFIAVDPEDPTIYKVEGFLTQLPDRERQLVEYKMMEHTHREVATLLGMSPSYVSVLIKKIQRKYLMYSQQEEIKDAI